MQLVKIDNAIDPAKRDYYLYVDLYNLSDVDQKLTFRFWFTGDIDGNVFTDDDKCVEYVDIEATIPKKVGTNIPGMIDLQEHLPKLSFYKDAVMGAYVSTEFFIDSYSIDEIHCNVSINLEGFRPINGGEIGTTIFDKSDRICDSNFLVGVLDMYWQEAFDGVILALSVFGGIIILCLVFTVVLLLPNKKKKVANEVANQVNINEANLKQENNNGVNNNQENANNKNNN